MATMKKTRVSETDDLNNVIFVCFDQFDEDDLPQVGDEDSIIVDLMQNVSNRPMDLVRAEFGHQIDSSFC